jgi:hypothetical protein
VFAWAIQCQSAALRQIVNDVLKLDTPEDFGKKFCAKFVLQLTNERNEQTNTTCEILSSNFPPIHISSFTLITGHPLFESQERLS